MSKQTHSQLVLLQAERITKGVPPDLPALQILQRPTAGPTVRLCAVGDIGLSGRAAATAKRWGADTLFAEVASVLQAADIAFGNLESPLAGEIAPDKMFAAPTEGAATLYKAGFNLIHLANNHVGEYGQLGLAATLDAVCKAGMIPLGAGENLAVAQQLVRTDVNGLRIGWLGCGRTLLPQNAAGPRYWEFDDQELLAAVIQTRPDVDVLIVSIHIGLMYIDYPRPEHKVMAERLMAAGTDLILMHHAHILQGVQVTSQARVCCYNLGNFLYSWEEGNVQTPVMLREQNEGAIFVFDMDSQGIAAAAALPTWIDESCRVCWATGERGRQILHRLERISRDLEGNFAPVFERQRTWRNTQVILKVLAFYAWHGNWKYVMDALRRTRLEHLKMLVRWLTGLGRGES
jgi:poly-gamma-glutamate synthesis protein (capsule biosynthesis protein)